MLLYSAQISYIWHEKHKQQIDKLNFYEIKKFFISLIYQTREKTTQYGKTFAKYILCDRALVSKYVKNSYIFSCNLITIEKQHNLVNEQGIWIDIYAKI